MRELIDLIRTTPLNDLRDVEYLEDELLPALGFNVDFPLYPERLHRYDGGLRSWQWPNQFAPYLVYLSGQNVQTYLEIGVHQGGTFIITVEYLKRFNPVHSAVAMDAARSKQLTRYCEDSGYEYYVLDSHDHEARRVLGGRQFDLCLIDGDHSYEGFHADWTLVHTRARLIALHDATNRGYPWIQAFYDSYPGRKHGYFQQYRGEVLDQYLPQYGMAVLEANSNGATP